MSEEQFKMTIEIFQHTDFQHIDNYEEVLSDIESDELYELYKVGHEKFGQLYLTPLQEYYILDAYYNCGVTPRISAEQLEQDLGISAVTIRKIIRRFGNIRTLSHSMRLYSVNEDYFEVIDTPEKAYWLGLLSADGHITKELDRVIISLKEEDGYLLQQFMDDIEYTGVLELDLSKKSKIDGRLLPQKRVRINSRKMAEDLSKWGCSTNKTKELSFPHWMEFSLRPHFARGFIDGDGWVIHRRGKYNDYLTIGWSGTWGMVFEMSMFFWNNTSYRNCSTHQNGTIYTNLTSGYFAIEIGDLIYKNATRKMKRKYDNYIYAKENFKIKRRNLKYGLT